MKMMIYNILSCSVQKHMISVTILVNGEKTSLTFFLTDISDDIEECVLFGFPGNSNAILTLNFCILYAKYYIYIKKLFNSNKFDFLNFMTYLKQKINIEKQICSTEGRNEMFDSFSLLLDHL